MRTLTVRKGSGTNWATGWHTLTISKAVYGVYNDAKYIDVGFEGYPDNFTMRVYEKKGKDGEEFAIGNLFRFANAGITGGLDSPDGNVTIKLDDSAEQLTGKAINVYFYRDGEYTRALKQTAPTVFENVVDTFTEEDVEYHKSKAEGYYLDYIKDRTTSTVSTNGEAKETEDIPF